MKRVRLMAALTAATVFITTGCQNDTESKIVGKYEHPALPGQTFEFHADHTFMNTTGAGTMDCIIKHPGTWKVDGDSLFITNDIQNTTYEFGDSVTEDRNALYLLQLPTASTHVGITKQQDAKTVDVLGRPTPSHIETQMLDDNVYI